MSTGKDGYSSNFFERSRDELHAVIDSCCGYIEAKLENAQTVTGEGTADQSGERKAA